MSHRMRGGGRAPLGPKVKAARERAARGGEVGPEVGPPTIEAVVTRAGSPLVVLRVPALEGALPPAEAVTSAALMMQAAAQAEVEAAMVEVLRGDGAGGERVDEQAIASFVMEVRGVVERNRR